MINCVDAINNHSDNLILMYLTFVTEENFTFLLFIHVRVHEDDRFDQVEIKRIF